MSGALDSSESLNSSRDARISGERVARHPAEADQPGPALVDDAHVQRVGRARFLGLGAVQARTSSASAPASSYSSDTLADLSQMYAR
ncbi:hypothetical protein AOB60_13020 [Streptomyces noursei]|uniref:Uncharacterized protein n=1 Tax=Streptomyces noursei TaxID=1971 RepID=A0A2N8PKK8_STRNR|nr:hypothetical protein AOB60_13020 [Streptomyces noursei]